jgi:hypothetical protein
MCDFKAAVECFKAKTNKQRAKKLKRENMSG